MLDVDIRTPSSSYRNTAITSRCFPGFSRMCSREVLIIRGVIDRGPHHNWDGFVNDSRTGLRVLYSSVSSAEAELDFVASTAKWKMVLQATCKWSQTRQSLGHSA